MILAGEKLLLAGPADLIDEEQAYQQRDNPEMQQALARQANVLEGSEGAFLWTVSTAAGQKLSEHKLASPPVFDGMAAANGRVFLACQDGSVVCWESQ
jgi:hypothetical protein